MDWTQIITTTIGMIGSICAIALPIILPIILNRSHKKTRNIAIEGNKDITSRFDKIETTVSDMRAEFHQTSIMTQGLHLLDVIEHRPHCWETIRQAFASYSASGGNGHVERVYRQWEMDFGAYYDVGEIPPSMIKAKTA